ncbi:MAG: diaminopimelate epimerase [Deltaproteobacteria bacterium]|nr:MAG: diaminopimelate epimerase [Deltaproteobacteria bacterium]
MRAFVKLQGLGNDFIVVDARDPISAAELEAWWLAPDRVQSLCRRGHGVGADGVILALPPRETRSSARMRILNADGSEPEMCGNGIRCLAKLLYDAGVRGEEVTATLPIETLAGQLDCEVFADDTERRGLAHEVCVAMGPARLNVDALPMLSPNGDTRHVDASLALGDDRVLKGTAVSMGNPHYVSFVEDDTVALAQAICETGPSVTRHEAFPRGTNVELARIRHDGSIELWVWERGCGVTQACGTGACATAAAAVVTGRASADAEIAIDLPGGRLTTRVAADRSQVWMRGPATEVYRGAL